MNGNKVTGKLELRWLPVVDRRGRKHMEAHWVEVSAPATTRHAA
jgi:hypothetical protein